MFITKLFKKEKKVLPQQPSETTVKHIKSLYPWKLSNKIPSAKHMPIKPNRWLIRVHKETL
jgi:hypothetical protein